jgi:chromosome partitioning protein
MIIGILGQKGGISKSTTAIHLCQWLLNQGKSVSLVDCDAQQSSTIWASVAGLAVVSESISTADDLLERIPEIGADYIVIDGAAGISELTRAAMLRADLVLIPCKASGLDIRSASDTIRVVRQAQSVRSGKPDAALFLSMAVPNTNLKSESLEILNELGLKVCSSVIHQRQCVADSFGQKSTVFDMPGRSATAAANEFKKLFKELAIV